MKGRVLCLGGGQWAEALAWGRPVLVFKRAGVRGAWWWAGLGLGTAPGKAGSERSQGACLATQAGWQRMHRGRWLFAQCFRLRRGLAAEPRAPVPCLSVVPCTARPTPCPWPWPLPSLRVDGPAVGAALMARCLHCLVGPAAAPASPRANGPAVGAALMALPLYRRRPAERAAVDPGRAGGAEQPDAGAAGCGGHPHEQGGPPARAFVCTRTCVSVPLQQQV